MKASDGKPKRKPLNRKRILETAIRVADGEGIEALSMRRLGQELGVEAMSLYNHVRNKEELLDGMVDLVFAEIDFPAGGDWRSALRRRAQSAREVLLLHPWAIGLMESRHQAGAANLRHHDAVLGALRGSGFSIAGAAHAYAILDAYVYGFTLTELTLPFRGSEDLLQVAGNILDANPMGEYPYLAEMINDYAVKEGYSYSNEFEYGLDLILDGLAKLEAGR